MSTEEALALIDKMLGNVRETRTIHRKIEEALDVVRKALSK